MARRLSGSRFPNVERADKHGLLLLGGKLDPESLLDAYTHGIFPWPIVDHGPEQLAWFSPNPRTILELDGLYISRRLERRLRQGRWTHAFDQQFGTVIRACADRDSGISWITPSIIDAYETLHRMKIAHSVEISEDGELVGGLYGLAIGGFFAAESMFHRRTDGSKAALFYLIEHLKQRGFTLLDVQQWTSHLGRMGAIEIPRREFLIRLEAALALEVRF